MAEATGRGVREGIGSGIIAGIIFALAEMAGAAMMGNPSVMPVRMFGSILLGRAALETTPIGTAVIVGVLVHLALSALFGLIYGLLNARLKAETQTRLPRQAGLGLLFGAVLWFVNFQVLARLFFPWFTAAPQLPQLILHAVFFGLPLALMYAGAEKRVQRIHRAPTPA